MLLAIGMFLVSIGLVFFIFPKAMYKFTDTYKNDNTKEAPKVFWIAVRLGGVVMIILGIIAFIAQFIL